MKTNFDMFLQWSKRPEVKYVKTSDEKVAVVYTRVSSKEQYDTNLSLDWQRKAIDEFASRGNIRTAAYFGGTYESAKTDGRKEFQRMLDYIKKNKNVITHVLVYLLDRFSRSGDGAMKLAKDLREKYGVTIIAVTQPIDTSNPGGVFQQNLQFLFSQYDNELRRQRAMAGIKEHLEQGIWCKKPPMGYSAIKEGKERRIVVNDIGKKLRKAFHWKAAGIKNDEILLKLKAMGVEIYKQKLSMMFSNPFYCGIIADKMLNGQLVEGTHEKLISPEVFLQIHYVRAAAKGKYGVTHKKENDQYPLKVFMKCDKCGNGYTGYVVKKKNKTNDKVHEFHYYKCRSHGCNCKQSTTEVNQGFVSFLKNYTLQPQLVEPLLYHMDNAFDRHYEVALEQQKLYKDKLADIEKKSEELEDDFYLDKKIPEDVYIRLRTKLAKEKADVMKVLSNLDVESSNLKIYFREGITLSTQLTTTWDSSGVPAKEKLQKFIFPQGVTYNREKGLFLTCKVNSLFEPIAQLNSITGGDKEKQDGIKAVLSNWVGWTRFELATPCTPYNFTQ
jgi:DNA invertase Pin-like site-specific DNA recombinase